MLPPSDDWIVLPRGPEDLRRWQNTLPKENFFVQWSIDAAGTPTVASRDGLLRAQITPEEILRLERIAAGAW